MIKLDKGSLFGYECLFDKGEYNYSTKCLSNKSLILEINIEKLDVITLEALTETLKEMHVIRENFITRKLLKIKNQVKKLKINFPDINSKLDRNSSACHRTLNKTITNTYSKLQLEKRRPKTACIHNDFRGSLSVKKSENELSNEKFSPNNKTFYDLNLNTNRTNKTNKSNKTDKSKLKKLDTAINFEINPINENDSNAEDYCDQSIINDAIDKEKNDLESDILNSIASPFNNIHLQNDFNINSASYYQETQLKSSQKMFSNLISSKKFTVTNTYDKSTIKGTINTPSYLNLNTQPDIYNLRSPIFDNFSNDITLSKLECIKKELLSQECFKEYYKNYSSKERKAMRSTKKHKTKSKSPKVSGSSTKKLNFLLDVNTTISAGQITKGNLNWKFNSIRKETENSDQQLKTKTKLHSLPNYITKKSNITDIKKNSLNLNISQAELNFNLKSSDMESRISEIKNSKNTYIRDSIINSLNNWKKYDKSTKNKFTNSTEYKSSLEFKSEIKTDFKLNQVISNVPSKISIFNKSLKASDNDFKNGKDGGNGSTGSNYDGNEVKCNVGTLVSLDYHTPKLKSKITNTSNRKTITKISFKNIKKTKKSIVKKDLINYESSHYFSGHYDLPLITSLKKNK